MFYTFSCSLDVVFCFNAAVRNVMKCFVLFVAALSLLFCVQISWTCLRALRCSSKDWTVSLFISLLLRRGSPNPAWGLDPLVPTPPL